MNTPKAAYLIFDTETERYVGAGLKPATYPKIWTTAGHAKSAIVTNVWSEQKAAMRERYLVRPFTLVDTGEFLPAKD